MNFRRFGVARCFASGAVLVRFFVESVPFKLALLAVGKIKQVGERR